MSRMAHEKNFDFLVEVVARLRREIPDVLLVIAGEGPARPHLMEPGRGAVAAPDDTAGFAAAVSALLRDPARRAAMSAEATEFAREWESGALARRLNAFYAALSVTAGADARIR